MLSNARSTFLTQKSLKKSFFFMNYASFIIYNGQWVVKFKIYIKYSFQNYLNNNAI